MVALDIFELERCFVYNFMDGFSIDLDAVNSFTLVVFLLQYFKVIVFVQCIIVVLTVVGISVDMVAEVEVLVLVYKNSRKATSYSVIFTCGQMKQVCPRSRPLLVSSLKLLVDNQIIFNFEFITPI